MQDAFDSGDHLHPSDEGYAQMAKTAYNKMTMEQFHGRLSYMKEIGRRDKYSEQKRLTAYFYIQNKQYSLK